MSTFTTRLVSPSSSFRSPSGVGYPSYACVSACMSGGDRGAGVNRDAPQEVVRGSCDAPGANDGAGGVGYTLRDIMSGRQPGRAVPTGPWTRLIRYIPHDIADNPRRAYEYGEPCDVDVDVGLALALRDVREAAVTHPDVDQGRDGCGDGHMDRAGETGEGGEVGMADGGLRVWVWRFEQDVPWSKGWRTGEINVVYPGSLVSPVPPEACGPMRCIGLNYTDHAAELNLPLPAYPEIFLLGPNAISSPGGVIRVPMICQLPIPARLGSGSCASPSPSATPTPTSNRDRDLGLGPGPHASPIPTPVPKIDCEVELAVVLARAARNVREEDAAGYVLGWTAANDVTDRAWQGVGSQWGMCKGFDTFLPLGPCLVSPTHRASGPSTDTSKSDVPVFKLETRIGDEVVQRGCTSRMIWSIPQLLAHLSRGTTLPAGTVIITGTPPGIGASKTPPRWLVRGDEVRCVIDGGIGSLISTVKYEM